MKYAFAAAAFFVLAITPAHATQGLLCRPEAREAPRVSLVIGAGGIAGASIDESGQRVSTMNPDSGLILAQAWIDRDQVMADIVSQTGDPVAQLRVRFEPPVRGKPQAALGTLVLRGRTFAVRCEED